MTRHIEIHPDGFAFLIVELFKQKGKLTIEAPDSRSGAFLKSALDAFSLKTVLFSPQFLLLERGGSDNDAQTAFSKIVEGDVDVLIVTPLSAKLKVPPVDSGEKIELKKNNYYKVSDIGSALSKWGYRNVPIVREPGDFAIRGDILDVGLFSSGHGARFEFFDEELENIYFFSTASQRNRKNTESVTIPRLLFSSVLRKDWKNILEFRSTNLSMKEILEIEELIVENHFSTWDIYPLFAGESSVSDAFNGTLIKWEETSGEVYLQEQLAKLDIERKKRSQEGLILPFDINFSFCETKPAEIFASSMLSSAEKIEKFRVKHLRLEEKLKTEPSSFFGKFCKDENCVIFFSKPNETNFFINEAEKSDIDLLQLKQLPLQIKKGYNYIVEQKPWFESSSILHFPDSGTYFVSSDFFKKHSSLETVKHEPDSINLPDQSESFNIETLQEGEFVVHYHFGIGIYEGIEKINETDCIVIKYDKEDKLFVPVYNMHFIYRYKYDEGYFPRLSSLRTATWEHTRNNVKKEIEKVAENILQLYAERSVDTTESMEINTEIYREFSSRFPYRLTVDQARSITELENDLNSSKITDRLLCGDVGFGKTEVSMRGCMVAIANGKQCAVLTPTTVLTFQHYRTFKERFSEIPVKIEMLSRFNSQAEQKNILKNIKEGKVDIVIGTHRLLSKDVEFKDLGFLVVDEEHRFGVTHKERIKDVRKNIASLSMTATPIPRTLQMSLLGIRKVSFIKTPPGERKSTVTYILNYSDEIIKEAIIAELSRGGQIYFVHNRVASLQSIKHKIESMVTGIKTGIAHGQMDEKDLEKVMVGFVNRDFDLLISTTLIESGIDIPLVNTIIINRADTFGLAQLYQLRGRVGRWNREAKAYLFVPNLKNLTPDAYSRLSVIKRYDYLGSGYDVATEDLNIRGGGNILGFKQSGKLRGVGNELYLELLKKRIDELKNGVPENSEEFEISSDIEAYIPENYIADSYTRVGFYRRISTVKNLTELAAIRNVLKEMFGAIPFQTENLLFLTSVKIESLNGGAYGIVVNRNNFSLNISPAFTPKNMDTLFAFIEKFKGKFSGTHTISFDIKKLCEISLIVSDFKNIFIGQAR